MKIVIRGRVAVVKNHLEDDQTDVTDESCFREIAAKNEILSGELYDPELAFRDYVHDGSEMGKSVFEALEPGGWVSLVFDESSKQLMVETEYSTNRPLAETEIEYLVKETVGQWSDGSGPTAMDDFSEHIEPYYVDLYPYFDDYDPHKPQVEISES